MDTHNRTVLPHHSNGKPKKDANKESKHIPRRDIEPRKTIANKLDGSGNPLHNIDSFHKSPFAQALWPRA